VQSSNGGREEAAPRRPRLIKDRPTTPRISKLVDELTGPDVLDIGCGGRLQGEAPAIGDPSWLHGQVRQRYPDAWGLELDPTKVERMVNAGYSNVVQGSADNFSLGQKFDSILAGDVIEHVPNPGSMLQSAAAHLKPHGVLIVSTGWPFGLPSLLYAWMKYPKTCPNPEHVSWFCVSTLSELAASQGLRVDSHFLVTSVDQGAGRLHRLVRPLYTSMSSVIPERARATTIGVKMMLDRV